MSYTKIDRLAVSMKYEPSRIREFLGDSLGHLAKPEYEARAGGHGFKGSYHVKVGGALVAWWGWGGTSQRGKCYVDVTGLGCGLVRDWNAVERDLGGLEGIKPKRLDIAADFYRGEVRHDDVLQAFRRGKFARGQGGRPCKMHQILPEDIDDGRTIYVGKRGNDVMLRAYEKGKKEFQGLPTCIGKGLSSWTGEDDEGNPFALRDWYRLELELRDAKRPLPLEVIGDRDRFFTGAYPYLQEVFPMIEPRVLVRPEHIAEAELAKSLECIRRQWGTTLFTALTVHGGDVWGVWKMICGKEHNERLLNAGVVLHGAGSA